jgi:hypothetical protein
VSPALLRRNFLLTAGAGLAYTFAARAWGRAAPPRNPALLAAINKAGRQRMVSQRLAKAWLMRAMGLLPDRAPSIFQQSMALFESQLTELGRFTPSSEVRLALARLGEEWPVYKALLDEAPTRDSENRLFEANEKVLGLANNLTLAYEYLSFSPIGRLVTMASRQRMLSQRMAKLYLFHQRKVQPALCLSELARARREFSSAHEILRTASQASPTLLAELDLVSQQWMFFQNALEALDGHERGAADVATTSERILEQMEVIVGLYEKLA